MIIGAIVLFALAVIGAMAFTGSESSGGNVHTMPQGQTMTGAMRTMENDQTSSGAAPLPVRAR